MELPKKKKVAFKGIVLHVYKKAGRAIAQYNMLEHGDKVLVAVSGGLDSLSLLELFLMRKARIPVQFDLIACFVDTNFIKVDKNLVEDYFKSRNVKYVIKPLTLDENNVDCFYCSWNRRKVLFETAREYQCNKLALGHNMDDINETTLMNLFFNGEISTMIPNLKIFDGEIHIIRPLCCIEKKDIIEFASHFSFPATHYDCPYSKDGRRQRMRELIQNLEKDCMFVKKNIFHCLERVKQDYLLGGGNE